MTTSSEGHDFITHEPPSREIITGTVFSERALELLGEPLFGVLAVQRPDGEIVQTEMWYDVIDETKVLMNTTSFRKKFSHLQQNPNVSLLVSRGNYEYVTMYGQVTLNDDQSAAQDDIRRLAERYLGPVEAEKIMREEFSREHRVSIVLEPTRITEYFSQ